GAPAPPPPSAALDETASYVLDDLEFPPGQVESPSQISQGTVSVASETEDTLAGVPAPRRSAPVMRPPAQSVEPAPRKWKKIAIAGAIVVAMAGAVFAAAWLLGLLQ